MNNKHQYYLKKIPTDWEKVPIEKLGTICSGGTPSRLVPSFWDGSIPWVTPGELTKINSKWLTQTKEYITESGLSDSAAKLMPKGTILVTTRATIGSVAVASIPICTNQGFKSIVPNEYTDSIFYYYLLEFIAPEIIKLSSGSTFDEISRRDFANIVVPRPPIKEQRRIAEILDTVDETIALTFSLIAKLKQIRAGLLHDLLTRGLDEDGKLRDAIAHPEMLKDFEIVNLASICHRITDGSHQSVKTSSSGMPFLYVSCIRDGRILWEQAAKISKQTYAQISKGREPLPGVILYTAVGSYGYAALVKEDCQFSFQRHIAYILPNTEKVFPEYLAWWLNSSECRRYADIFALGNAQKTVTLGELAKFPVPLPNYKQQKLIASVLEAHNNCILTEEAHLDKLKLQKKGLMHDLLTGKVRVNQI